MHRRALSSTGCRRGTHYDTLGIRREASVDQIKVYISIFHRPRLNLEQRASSRRSRCTSSQNEAPISRDH
ncbi:hypothetical protein B0H12DRAFT_1138609 [Mycena haematopus]|nr:hypothetical protein B0H12DRAFT_1138609 [Mycena haematopus]